MFQHNKFRYWKQQILCAYGVDYVWALHHKETHNAIHFHGTQYSDGKSLNLLDVNQYNFCASGLEWHHATGQGNPDYEHCQFTGGKCWHDGTSLYAKEQLGFIDPEKDDEYVWSLLHSQYSAEFEKREEASDAGK